MLQVEEWSSEKNFRLLLFNQDTRTIRKLLRQFVAMTFILPSNSPVKPAGQVYI